MVWALGAIVFLSFIVWLHHFFTMGAGANVNAFFGIMTMLIAVPTGVKVFNWVFTMFEGKVHFATPMLWFMGFLSTFVIGGMTGVLMSVAAVDFQVHNSLFLIGHFHSMVIGGVLFGVLSAISYWFPKYTGFMLHERLGRWVYWCWFWGFPVAFLPLYVLGFMGATRRLDHYDAATGWQPWFVIAAIGAAILAVGTVLFLVQLIVSIVQRKKLRDTTGGDPWDGRTLEWSTSSPPPFYNFAIIPEVHTRDAFWEMKKHKTHEKKIYEPIHMPKNTPIGMYIGGFAFLFGFSVIWQMHWLTILSFAGLLISMIYRLSEKETDYYVSVSEIEKIEGAR